MEDLFKSFEIDGLTYSVNPNGVIKNQEGKIIKQRITYDGYSVVTLGRNKHRKTYRVHRIVAKMFIPNPNNLEEVNHKNFNKQDNSIENLEWISRIGNIVHAIENGRHISKMDIRGEKNPNYGNDKLKTYYQENPQEKEKLVRKGTDNGMAKSVSIYKDNTLIKHFSYMGECAEWLIENNYTKSKINGIRDRITVSIKMNKKYLGFNFKFE